MSRRKELFTPLKAGGVRMYVCGVTVYDECHLGHARSAVVFDVICRYLEHLNFEVTFVKNFTDIDDKIIKRAEQEAVPWQAITGRYIDAYHRDMERLGVRLATLEPKATEHVNEIVTLIQALIEKGLLERLPLSFSAFCLDQMKEWDLLFPAERNYFERLFTLLDRSAPPVVERLFTPLRDIERKMGVNEKTWPKGQFTLEQVDFLNRNPYYPEWRAAVAQVFAQLDPLLDAETARRGHARLAIVIAPAQLPADPPQSGGTSIRVVFT